MATTVETTMVDCTPEPLMETPTKTVEEESTAPTEAGSCASPDIDSSCASGGDIDSTSELAVDSSGESEVETDPELEVSEDEHVEEVETEEVQQNEASAKSMALNDAFLALENMRKFNLEVEYGGKAIPNVTLLHEYCTTCLEEQKEREEKKMRRLSQDPDFMSNPNNEKRRKWAKQLMTRIRTKKRSPPCLVCTSPVCPKHCCKDFRKEKINVCSKCAQLFTMDFVVAAIAENTDEQKRRHIAHMIDSYDRALLMLRYSAQYIDEIVAALEDSSRQSDHISLGSSGVGLMSGFTGVGAVAAQFAAAAAILSPAGPALLVASILFGASAAAASTGTELVRYNSEPNQLACKIIALYDLVRSLLGVTSVLKDAITRGHIDARHYTEMAPTKKRSTYWKSRLPEPVKTPTIVETVEKEDEEEDTADVTETTVNLQDSPTSTTSAASTPAEAKTEKASQTFQSRTGRTSQTSQHRTSTAARLSMALERMSADFVGSMMAAQQPAEYLARQAAKRASMKPQAEKTKEEEKPKEKQTVTFEEYLAQQAAKRASMKPQAEKTKDEDKPMEEETVTFEENLTGLEQPSSTPLKGEESKQVDLQNQEDDKPVEEATAEKVAEPDSGDATPQVTEAVTTQPEQVQYSLADIDDDDDIPPGCEEKQDADTIVTESTSFESQEEQVATPAKEGEELQNMSKVYSLAAAAGVVVSPTTSESAQTEPTSTEITVAPSNKRTALSRVTTNVMKVAQVASIACVMLSAATIVMETKNLRDTLESLRRGSPCEKAAMLRKIKEEIDELPETGIVAEGCESYLKATAKQEQAQEELSSTEDGLPETVQE